MCYAHVKQKLTRRFILSDVFEGTYLIVVAEGLKDASGKEIVDESAGVDAFGHKKLAGAAKYVCQELTKRLKADTMVKDFMKDTHMYVEKLYEIPEVRSVTPGHLVRCGRASAYDVNFGKEAGAAAVKLLVKGITGVTVSEVKGKEVRYMPADRAIVQRHVDLSQVALFEQLGTCFGRNPEKYEPVYVETKGSPERYM
ncbi:MAG TPA: hypothetical protein PKZ41_01020 [Candidatus Omnitrophota bacterium]|nr:hypothetical protein [Candidatus Omnitrophota bacterium]